MSSTSTPNLAQPASLPPICVSLVIGTDAATLSHAAFEVAPARAVRDDGEIDAVTETIARRLSRYLPITG